MRHGTHGFDICGWSFDCPLCSADALPWNLHALPWDDQVVVNLEMGGDDGDDNDDAVNPDRSLMRFEFVDAGKCHRPLIPYRC